MPLAEDVLAHIEGLYTLEDSDVTTTCPACSLQQALNEARVTDSDHDLQSRYHCAGCDKTILIVSTPGVIPWNGRGYRLGDLALRNPSDLYIQQAGMVVAVKLDASPHALH